MKRPEYRGRFAPSPTGPLHFGSLVAALGSYLDAKYHHGNWLVRMEDLDTPRCVAGAADDILRTLEVYGLHWDGEVIYQSQRTSAYEHALQQLQDAGVAYPCCCTRKEIADSALHGIDGPVYPGTCRNGVPAGRTARAWRVNTHLPTTSPVSFIDRLQGRISQRVESDIGDFVVKRADDLFAYQLAVVVDDAYQGITDVVRGADLLLSTPRQILLQQLLTLPTPHYLHLPIIVNAQGEKLSKQTLAEPIRKAQVVATLFQALCHLQQLPHPQLAQASVNELLDSAIANWQPERLAGLQTVQAMHGSNSL
ncbi:MAG: tRNA glutamyl-Q(34) synthetase GluQRS [Gallionella sp.]|nr:tRNA glutamyl-Q(34) synthetase GluQRS [Gallionella sp.]